ncbi:hypothetical protein, partial [Raoultella ornithinolytica]|uniref:hypothetical protein n=1 Tax=Raoultella ornithinolytica TaxID=54291 RepID=UPI0019D49DCC
MNDFESVNFIQSEKLRCMNNASESLDGEESTAGSADKFLDLQELIYAFIRGPDSGRRTLLPVRKESLRCRHGAG